MLLALQLIVGPATRLAAGALAAAGDRRCDAEALSRDVLRDDSAGWRVTPARGSVSPAPTGRAASASGRWCWCSPSSPSSPRLHRTRHAPLLGVVLISLGVLLDDALLALIGLVVGRGRGGPRAVSRQPRRQAGEQPLLVEQDRVPAIHRLARSGGEAGHRTLSVATSGGGISSRSSFCTCSVVSLRLRQPADRARSSGSRRERISVNLNTMYPLPAGLEGSGLVDAQLGASGPAHPALLLDHARRPARVQAPPRVRSSRSSTPVIRSVSLIKGEVYGDARCPRGGAGACLVKLGERTYGGSRSPRRCDRSPSSPVQLPGPVIRVGDDERADRLPAPATRWPPPSPTALASPLPARSGTRADRLDLADPVPPEEHA